MRPPEPVCVLARRSVSARDAMAPRVSLRRLHGAQPWIRPAARVKLAPISGRVVFVVQDTQEGRVDLATQRTHQIAHTDELAPERAMVISILHQRFLAE